MNILCKSREEVCVFHHCETPPIFKCAVTALGIPLSFLMYSFSFFVIFSTGNIFAPPPHLISTSSCIYLMKGGCCCLFLSYFPLKNNKTLLSEMNICSETVVDTDFDDLLRHLGSRHIFPPIRQKKRLKFITSYRK